jgi:hypothetical protein
VKALGNQMAVAVLQRSLVFALPRSSRTSTKVAADLISSESRN